MVNGNDKINTVIANIGIVTAGVVGLYLIISFLNRKKAPTPSANRLPDTITIDGVMIPTSRVMTNGKFDNSKFNALFEEVKDRRTLLIKRKEDEELERLNKDVPLYPPIMDMKVYEIIYDYEQNVREIVKDIVNGENWTKGSMNRQLYFGATLIMLSLMYFVLKMK